MPDPIIVIDTSEILEGKLHELEAVVKELAAFVHANEPRPILYNVFFNEGGTKMTVLQIHPDSASMEFHMEVAGSAFPQFKNLLKMSTMDIYGKPSEKLVKQMHEKAHMLGAPDVGVHELQSGFSRIRVP
jgi:hypothetical protein